jgi:CubicO group peptidase (beta-lactamase class C family)
MTLRRLLAAPLTLAAVCCGSSHPTDPDSIAGLHAVTPTPEWPSSTPAAERLDAARLDTVVRQIRRGDYGRITSLLVVRNGRLVVEEYFNGSSASQPHTVQSVTKSVTSLLVGLAVHAGRLRLDDRVVSFFPQYEPLDARDERKNAVTVADLLTMRSGLDWDESIYQGSPLQRLNDCRCDWLRFVLDWPMRDAPGARWEYVSGATILLGGVVGAATGSRLDLFAASQLFAPLQTQGESWVHGLPDGLPHAGGGLYLRPRDMAKIGVLLQDDGQWLGQQVVDASWIRSAGMPLTRGVRTWSGHSFDYGSGWWITDYHGLPVITASGTGGQWIFVVPSLRVVVATTADNDDRLWSTPVTFLYSDILPSAEP